MDVKRIFFGYKASSTRGSNIRRIQNRICIYVTFILIISAVWNTVDQTPKAETVSGLLIASPLVLLSLFFFYNSVLRAPFRSSSDFIVNPQRLFLDTIVSSLFLITTFAYVYWLMGFRANVSQGEPTRLDALYFSAVTFSTLGFGDYSPVNFSKLFAAIQAILGNIHLGFLVASTFAAMQKQQD